MPGALRKGVVMHTESGEWKEFQMNPPTTEEELSVAFEAMESPGSTHPFFQYSGGNPDSITFTIHLDDKLTYKGHTNEFIEFLYRFHPVEKQTQMFGQGFRRTRTPGDYFKKFKPPSTIYISYGDFIREGILVDMRLERNRFDPETLIVVRAEVDLTIQTIRPI